MQMIGEVSNHLWQSTVFAVMAGLLTLAFRKNRAQVRYWLWFSASLKFLIPFSLLLTLGSNLGRSQAASSVAVPSITYTFVRAAEPFSPGPSPAPSTRSHGDWIPIAVVSLWACGLAGIGLIRLRGWLRIRAAVRSSLPMDIPFPVRVRASPSLLEPGVVGFSRPVLLLPAGIVERLTPTQLQAVLAHERCHIERRDNLTAAIHMVVEGAFWFHPLVWWISARLVEERERACDEGVLELGSEPRLYAESILKTCKFCAESPLTCVSGVTGADLKKRIIRIMTQYSPGKLGFGKKLLLLAVVVAAVAIPVVFGLLNAPRIRPQSKQSAAAPLPSFEVASIKPNRSRDTLRGAEWPPGRYTATNQPIKVLIEFAYNVQDFQLSGGPNWIASDRYDVDAKVDDSLAAELKKLSYWRRRDQIRLMVQSLLADRFSLRLSHKTEILPIYALVIAKTGAKLQESKPDEIYSSGDKRQVGEEGEFSMSHGQLTAEGFSMEGLVWFLSWRLGRPVLDQTGLKGNYDFTLQWTPDESPGAMAKVQTDAGPGTFAPPLPGSSGPSIFTAIQEQLGLKLESTKGPLDVIVIDHIERPSEN
jgi:uncharacterized protein (TIGR03435 family)